METTFTPAEIREAFHLLKTQSSVELMLNLLEISGPEQLMQLVRETRIYAEKLYAESIQERDTVNASRTREVLHTLTDVAIDFIDEANEE